MEVLLRKDYPQLGFIGETVIVKNGFARNFLIPQEIAVEINKRNQKYYRNLLDQVAATRNKQKEAAQELAEKIAAENWEFTLKMGDQGKSFGSVTSRDIKKLIAERGYDIDASQVALPAPIKFAGKTEFKVRLHAEVEVACELNVLADKKALEEQKAAKAAMKRAQEDLDREKAAAEELAVEPTVG